VFTARCELKITRIFRDVKVETQYSLQLNISWCCILMFHISTTGADISS
jgi:hypothetical protein